MSDIKLLTELYFEGRPFNLKIKAVYIKILGIFNSFKSELKVKSSKL